MRLFVGDDWPEDYHDVELMDARGRVLARKRLPEGVAGMARLHELTGGQLGGDAGDAEVIIGTGTGRGPWVAALVAAGYTVYGVNPLQAARARQLTRRPRLLRHPSAPPASSTTPPCASSPAGSSASCTDASRHRPPTTSQPPGPTAKTNLPLATVPPATAGRPARNGPG